MNICCVQVNLARSFDSPERESLIHPFMQNKQLCEPCADFGLVDWKEPT
jgi:hypothetical protein